MSRSDSDDEPGGSGRIRLLMVTGEMCHEAIPTTNQIAPSLALMYFYIASHWPLAGHPANQQARQRTRPQHQRNTSATPTQQHRNSRRTSKNNALLHNVAPLGGERSGPAMYGCMNNVQPRAGGPVKQQRVPPPGRSPTLQGSSA